MGKQEASAATVVFVVSLTVVVFVLVRSEGVRPVEVTVHGDDALLSESARPTKHEREEAEYAAFIEERMRRRMK